MDLFEGYKWRQKQEMRRLAQHASWVTAPHLKKAVPPSKLLEEDKPKKKTNPEESKKVIGELEKMVGVS